MPLGAPAILGLLGSERPEPSQLGGVQVEQHLAGQGFHLLAGDLHGDRPPVGEDLQLGEWPLDVNTYVQWQSAQPFERDGATWFVPHGGSRYPCNNFPERDGERLSIRARADGAFDVTLCGRTVRMVPSEEHRQRYRHGFGHQS